MVYNFILLQIQPVSPINIDEVKELENVRMLWNLAVWFIAVSWPILSGLIIYFYLKSNKYQSAHIEELRKENEAFKELFKDQIKKI